MCLKGILGDRILERICVLTYYTSTEDYWFEHFKGCISMLKELVGLKHVITTKKSFVHVIDFDSFVNEGKFRDFIHKGVEKGSYEGQEEVETIQGQQLYA